MIMAGCAVNASAMSNVPACAIWMSIILPIFDGLGINKNTSNFAKAVIIEIPITSLTGGIITPAGSSTNILALSLLKELHGIEIPFVSWVAIGLPLGLIMTVVSWYVIIKVFPVEIKTIGKLILAERKKEFLGTQFQMKKVMIISVIGGMPLFLTLFTICLFTIMIHLPIPVIPTIISAIMPAMAALAISNGVNPIINALEVAFASLYAFLLSLDAVPLIHTQKVITECSTICLYRGLLTVLSGLF